MGVTPTVQTTSSTVSVSADTPPHIPPIGASPSQRTERRVPMTRIRKRTAERLKMAQSTAAALSTFNECDMSALVAMRAELNESFQKTHGVKFGFMSAFVMAATKALQRMPTINAYIEDDSIVYKDYVDISVAVATPTGLLVPVLRDCETKSLADIERELGELAGNARKGRIALEDMAGGSMTISNGGIYGSMLSTPLLNLPQSCILGMHAITNRPVVVDGQIVIRPIMYLALTYDHRLIDGREGATFLKTIRQLVEDPRRMLLDV